MALAVPLEALLAPSHNDNYNSEHLILDAIATSASRVINCGPPTATSTPVPPMREFVERAVGDPPRRSRHHPDTSITRRSVLVTTLVYLERLRRKLPPTAKGMYCTAHRICLAALLVATKFLQDPPIKNKQWSSTVPPAQPTSSVSPSSVCATPVSARRLFSLAELNLMERQFLFLIGFELTVTHEQAVEAVLECVPTAVPSSPTSSPSSSPTLAARSEDESTASESISTATATDAKRHSSLPVPIPARAGGAFLVSPPTSPPPPPSQRPPLPSSSVTSATSLLSSSLSASASTSAASVPPVIAFPGVASAGGFTGTSPLSRSLISDPSGGSSILLRRVASATNSSAAAAIAAANAAATEEDEEVSDGLPIPSNRFGMRGSRINSRSSVMLHNAGSASSPLSSAPFPYHRSAPRPVPSAGSSSSISSLLKRRSQRGSTASSSSSLSSSAGIHASHSAAMMSSSHTSTSSLLSTSPSSSVATSPPALFAWMSAGSRVSLAGMATGSGRAARRWSAVRRVLSVSDTSSVRESVGAVDEEEEDDVEAVDGGRAESGTGDAAAATADAEARTEASVSQSERRRPRSGRRGDDGDEDDDEEDDDGLVLVAGRNVSRTRGAPGAGGGEDLQRGGSNQGRTLQSLRPASSTPTSSSSSTGTATGAGSGGTGGTATAVPRTSRIDSTGSLPGLVSSKPTSTSSLASLSSPSAAGAGAGVNASAEAGGGAFGRRKKTGGSSGNVSGLGASAMASSASAASFRWSWLG